MTYTDPKISAVANEVSRQLIAEGRLIEGGFQGLLHTAYPGHAISMPPAQRRALREAFFAGAQHLLGAIMGTLDPDADPTVADMARMEAIHKELDGFIAEFARDHIATRGRA